MSQPNTSEKSNDLDRQENLTRGELSVKKVAIYSYDASTDTIQQGLLSPQLTKRYDLSSSTIIYTATAPIGTADASLGWTITKFDLTNTADSSGKIATDVSWTNHALGSYS